MGYKAVTRIKSGDKEDGFEYLERGDTVTSTKAGGKEEFEALKESRAIVSDDEYDVLFPESRAGANQPMGTPSNLEQVEGTELQAPTPEEPKEEDQPPVAPLMNPADPPQQKKEGDAAAYEKSHKDQNNT